MKRLHYGWVMVAVTFAILLVTAAVRATPGVLMVPLEEEFRWSAAQISLTVAVNIALFGLIGPFAASAMERWGLRRVVTGALTVLTAAVALTSRVTNEWQFFLLWGLCVGAATGVTAMVLAVVVASRWFEKRTGTVLGFLSAANATGQLLFLPLLARVIQSAGWRRADALVAVAAALALVAALLLLRDRPQDVGLEPYGRDGSAAKPGAPAPLHPLPALRLALRSPAFWVLGGSFAICGASTNGLVGTHLIPACHDAGIPEVRAAGLLATMGVFDIVGTTASGWLTDRFSSRYLLFVYYALRGLSLFFLPAVLREGGAHLQWFAVFYGLDWIATVPPTVRLTAETFGRENSGVVYGWIGACHQLGASAAALAAGTARTVTGGYGSSFWATGILCFLTGFAFLFFRRALTQARRDGLPAAGSVASVPQGA